MSIKNTKIVIRNKEVAFRIDGNDAVEAFETITRKKITFSVAYDDDSLLIYPPRNEAGEQYNVQGIQDALDAD